MQQGAYLNRIIPVLLFIQFILYSTFVGKSCFSVIYRAATFCFFRRRLLVQSMKLIAASRMNFMFHMATVKVEIFEELFSDLLAVNPAPLILFSGF